MPQASVPNPPKTPKAAGSKTKPQIDLKKKVSANHQGKRRRTLKPSAAALTSAQRNQSAGRAQQAVQDKAERSRWDRPTLSRA